jgi:catechol 2,3-dioxygenase-like lactoylglutathione lyase family enzyme
MKEFPLKGIDHTLVGVRDLEAARALWTRMGFTLTPRGRHIGWGTANYCIMFSYNYIELLGVVDPTQFTNNLDKFLETREGLMGLAFASDDVDATKARLIAAGLHPDGPKDLKRLLELPEGTVAPEFRLLYLPKEETPDLSAFVCCHLTPHLVRRHEWMLHKNSAERVKSFTVLSQNPNGSAEAYRSIFGQDSVRSDPGASRVTLAKLRSSKYTDEQLFHGVDQLVFTDRETLHREYPGIDAWPPHPSPLPVVMTIGVWDHRTTVRCLKDAGFSPRPFFHGPYQTGCWLPPDEANGMILHFDDDR